MRNLKILCLALSAAAVMSAFAGVGTAGATVLCAEAKSPCPKDFAAGTELAMSLKSESSSVWMATSGEFFNGCNFPSISATTSNTGGKGTAVKAAITGWGLEKCIRETEVVKNGELEVTHISGTHNGTLWGRNIEFEFETIFGPCVYGPYAAPGAAADIGILVGGAPAKITINGVVGRTSGSLVCPPTLRWAAEINVNSPNPLYVEPE